MHETLWRPHADAKQHTQLGKFWQLVESTTQTSLPHYRDLHQWSVAHSETFWRLLMDHTSLIYEGDNSTALVKGKHFNQASWFPNIALNYAENLLHRRDEHVALRCYTELGEGKAYTYGELYQHAAAMANALLKAGVQPGDRVAAWLPNGAEAIIGLLGCAWIGAIWSSCSPDFGVKGVLDRFGQIAPKVLLVTDGYHYNGQWRDISERVSEVCGAMKGTQVVQIPSAKSTLIANATKWDDWLQLDQEAPAFVRQPFNAPLAILYSSGTTGKPKCIVHGTGGPLLQHAKEHRLHGDLGPEDVLFYYTTCGWMMWNWLVAGLQSGATLVLYDGNPAYPHVGHLFELAERTGITHFGTSARFVQALAQAGFDATTAGLPLNALRVLYSTGSPLLDSNYDYIYEHIKQDLQVSSISGGTDIISCFALGNPLLPVHKGSLQCIGLGMDVAVFDVDGKPLREGQGELVCRAPFPSMPVAFWNDDDGSLYHGAYFDRFPNIWAHGDFAEFIPYPTHDALVIHGRSDAVLNPGGVRIGTAEIYRQLVGVSAIKESVIVGRQRHGDVELMLFVVLNEGHTLTDTLAQEIRNTIRAGATPRHVPHHIHAVADIPRTLSGKTVELAVRDIIHGREVKNASALANPEALVLFEKFREERAL